MGYKGKEQRRAYAQEWYHNHSEQVLKSQKDRRLANPEYALWKSAKNRSQKEGIEFSIKLENIFIPKVCPILKIPLSMLGSIDNSPSLDRVDPTKGYVKDNVRVISHKANAKKQNNTIEDCELFIRYMKGLL